MGRSSHVFGLLARFTRPLAITPSADQIPVKSTHSMMLWPQWVVLIAGSTASAIGLRREAILVRVTLMSGWSSNGGVNLGADRA
jgi:hypothetical protein